jgi:uncharacterized protein DUF2510
LTIAPVRPVPADWYADPSGLPDQRWWDGRQWTDLLRPVPVAGAPTVSVRVAAPGPSRTAEIIPGRNQAARYALFLGLVSVLVNPFLVPSLIAVAGGLIGIRRATRQLRAGRTPFGGSAATWGLAAGFVGLTLSVAFKGMLI